jgi:hypothetical protein
VFKHLPGNKKMAAGTGHIVANLARWVQRLTAAIEPGGTKAKACIGAQSGIPDKTIVIGNKQDILRGERLPTMWANYLGQQGNIQFLVFNP